MATAAVVVGMGLMAYSSAGQYSATKAGGEIQKVESETQAEAEELAATQQEADRKARLAEALASQVSGSGASGIQAFSGSPLTILQADIESEQKATRRGRFQSELRAEGFRMRGRTAQKMANQQAKMGLLSSIGQMGSMVGRGLK
jgi:hypothetical protein